MVKVILGLFTALLSLLSLEKLKLKSKTKKLNEAEQRIKEQKSALVAAETKTKLQEQANEIDKHIATRLSRDDRVRKYDRKS